MEPKSKPCSHCNVDKPLSSFNKNKDGLFGRRSICKLCVKEVYGKKYWEKSKEKHKWLRIKRIFGLSKSDYNRMFEEQYGCCAICGTHQSKLNTALAIDHSHFTGKIRDLLCNNCNLELGIYENRKDKFDSYLKKHD